MHKKIFLILFVVVLLKLVTVSSLIVDAPYIVIYPGEQGKIEFEIENNEKFYIEQVSMVLNLNNLPFTSIGSSEKDVDDIDEDRDETVSFTLRASTDIVPGDYNIPFTIKYLNAEDNDQEFESKGSFGLRVSAKTDIDFSIETRGDSTESAIVGQKGKISLEIINKGLGEVKSVSIQIFPEGFELLSSEKVFVGTINAEDSDIVTFDVIFTEKNPILIANLNYKDFDNQDKDKELRIPLEIYTQEEALKLGILQKSNITIYIVIIIVIIILWIVIKRIRKRRKNKKKNFE